MKSPKKSQDSDEISDPRIKETIELTVRELSSCRLCPLECGVDRVAGAIGACGASLDGEVFYAGLLVGEEEFLNPCYEVFFTGCNLSCRFCYLADKVKSNARTGKAIGVMPLEGHPLHHDLGLMQAKSISVVGGEPAANLLAALRLFESVPVRPRVWNSNMYYTGFAREAVSQIADVVIADIHFGNDACAQRIAGVGGYLETVLQSIEHAVSSGLSVVVRHLLLPGHVDCCALPVVRIMKERFPKTPFHLLENYLPPTRVRAGCCPELAGRVSRRERARVARHALASGLLFEAGAAAHIERGKSPGETIPSPDRYYSCDDKGEIIIDADGGITIPHLTPGLLELMAEMREEQDGQTGDA